jgi:aryl-alcohol dehydrogenase
MNATAAVTHTKGAPFELRELELDALRPDELVVRVAASGICHTDLICRDQWYPVPLPVVLGHEGAGVVEAIGSQVTKVKAGDRVGMTFDSCGHCGTCQRGKPSYCGQFFEYNFGSSRPDGSSAFGAIHAHFFGQSSFATRSVARERNVVKIESDIPLEIAAPFGCGIQTGAGGVLNSLAVPAGSSLAVFGSGTVGMAAVLAGVIAGATTIIAVDVNESRLSLAKELGATHTVNASETGPVEVVKAITKGGADFSLETSGLPQVLRQCVDCLVPTGVAGVIGAPAFGTEVTLDVNTILTGGRVIRGIVEGDSVPDLFLPKLITLWEQGRFPVDRLMTFYDFDDIERAAHDAESGTTVKAVLKMA